MKVYTRGGDGGKTSLFSGERVSKADARVDAYGDLDELNSLLGVVVAALPDGTSDLRDELTLIQGHLMRLGALLATAPASPSAGMLAPMTADDATGLEQAIDRLQGDLEPLRSFVLPGGHPSAALAHVARTVCRRLERKVVVLAGRPEDRPPHAAEALVFLNRLSDYLFVFARACNRRTGTPDTPWTP